MAKDKGKYIFYINKLHKSWRKGYTFGDDKASCVIETLNEYNNRPKPWDRG